MHCAASGWSAPGSSEVPEMAEPSKTEQRRAEHVNIILNENVSAEYNYWNDIRLVHNALPEIDLDDIDLGVKFFGKRLRAPLIISSMTGGFGMGREINSNLAKAAAEVGVAMGVGSQRAALEKPDLIPTYAVVKDHGVPLIFANLGAPQLVPQEGKRAYGLADAKKAVDMIHADALIVHLNFLQEVVQPEGDRRAKGCLAAIRSLAATFPVMAKETGAGISRETATLLKQAGVQAIDVGGLGGTSFSAVEHYRARKEASTLKERLGATFWNWGIPTPASIRLADVGLPLVATGGIRSGLDAAKGIALGATMAGMAKPMLEAAKVSADAVVTELRAVIEELKAAMFLTGSTSIEQLQDRRVIVSPPTATWLEWYHLYTLFLDDIMDEDVRRRTLPSAWSTNAKLYRGPDANKPAAVFRTRRHRYGVSQAILDALRIRSLAERSIEGAVGLHPSVRLELLSELTNVDLIVSDGQGLDIDFEGMERIPEEAYVRMSEAKTGRLYLGAAATASIAARASSEDRAAIEAFARTFAVAFQDRDDLLGSGVVSSKVGGSAEGDIRQGKRTRLYVLALERIPRKDRAAFLRSYGRGPRTTKKDVSTVRDLLRRFALPETERRIESNLAAARKALDRLSAKDVEARNVLEALMDAQRVRIR